MARGKTNTQQKQSLRTKAKNAVKTVLRTGGEVAIPGLQSILTRAVKAAIPLALGAGARGASRMLGLPFETSGMMASASPVPLSSGIQVSAPASNGKVSTTGAPSMKSRTNGNVVVRHREFVADLNVEQTGFDLQFSFGVNPGNHALFPWLSQIATRFETYAFRQLRIIYEPQCGTSSTGTLMLAIDYDSSDPPPTSKSQMMSYKNSVRSPLWFACSHVSSPPDLHRLKTNYVLAGVAPQGTDIKTYDIGNLFIALQSNGSNQSAGELYVEYDVELMTPQISFDPPSATVLTEAETALEYSPFVNPTNVFGPIPIRIDNLTSGTTNISSIFVGQAGFYMMVVYLNGSSTDPLTPNIAIQQTGSYQGFQNAIEVIEGSSTSLYLAHVVFEVQNPDSAAILLTTDNNIPWAVSYLQLAQIASSTALVSASGVPVINPATQNPRARLGRINPYPFGA